MKKLLVLLMILALSVALIACGGEVETQAPDTEAPETQAPDTEPAETEHVHEIEVEEVLATCSARGYRIETCKTCGETISEVALPKEACTPNGDATCVDASVCTVCGKVLAAATGHVWADKQTVVSTCTADGKETATCSVCGTVEETVIPMIAHIMGVVSDEKAATCTEAGYRKGACVMCEGEVTETLTPSHNLIGESFFTAEDGTYKATCHSCGDIAITLETRVNFTFDMELEAEIASLENGDKLTLVDSTVSSVYKKANAVIAANEDRSVLAPKRPVMIDFDPSLLSDSSYYIVSFDYYISQIPQPSDPGNPNRATVFAFLPGYHGGGKVVGGGDFANFTKYTFGKGLIYSQYGRLGDLDNKGAVLKEIESGKWYHMTYVIDNKTGTAYAYVDGEFIASPIMDVEGLFAVTPETDAKFEGNFTMIFADDYVKQYGAQFDNFNISVVK